jgi:membrane associated rhomboid family serine protease
MLFPIGFDAPKMRRPIVIYILAGLCVLIWLLARNPMHEAWSLRLLLISGDTESLRGSLRLLGYPQAVIDAIAPWTQRPWTLVTAAFFHADAIHLLGNMAFLVIFGRAVDGWMGSTKFVLSYLLLAVLSAGGYLCFRGAQPTAMLGASGAISGVMGLAAAFFPRQRIKVIYFILLRPGVFEVRAFWAMILWFAWDLGKALLFKRFGGGGVAFMAHVMGFGAGVGCGLLFLRFGWVARHDGDLLRWWFEKKSGPQRAQTAVGQRSVGRATNAAQGANTKDKRKLLQTTAELLLASRTDPAAVLDAMARYRDLLAQYPDAKLPAFTEKIAVEISRRQNEPALETKAIERFLIHHPQHKEAQTLAMRGIELCKNKLFDPLRAQRLKQRLREII